MTAIEFLLSIEGGRIVSSKDLTEIQIHTARVNDQFFFNEDTGFGWAVVPWRLNTGKDIERAKTL